ncbi:hypothetical protein ACKKBG_A25515 [Auxenochlorella protothecoides x Auxenochlorella symbiontica]
MAPLLDQLSPTQQAVDTYLAHSLDMNRDFPGMDAPDASSWPAASVSQGPASAGREGGWEQAISELLASLASSQLQQLGACLEQFFQMLKVVGVLLGPRAAAGTVHALLLRTAALLGHRLRDTVDLPALLAAAPEAAQSRLAAAAGACDAWRRGYLATRAELEAGGQTGRWEHDRAALFAGTDHAAGACRRLAGALAGVHGVLGLLGADLESVAGAGLDRLAGLRAEARAALGALRDAALAAPPGDFLDPGSAGRWDQCLASLEAAGKSLAAGAQDLLDTSLTRCPGAADGARLLGKLLRDRHAGVALLRHVPEKVTDLVQTFAAEIRVAEREADRWCEGGAGNRTPYPGLSALTSTLLRVSATRSRLEEAATAIQASGEALTPEDQGVMAACAALVQRLALAEVDIWRDWVERAEREVGTAMRQPLLVQPPQEAASGWPLARIKLPELSDHVQAAQQARCLGIAVPPFLRGAALALPLMLEAGRRLQALLQQLAESRRKLRSPERLLLQPALEKVRLALLPGTQHMHWGSLSLDAFISSVQKAIAAFTCTAKAVACAASEMRRALRALPRETDWPGEGTDTGSRVIDHAATNAGLGGSVRRGEEAAVAAAHSLQATLVRIEEGVLGTSTGSARSMAAYYEHWERRLQDALADCAISWIEGLTSRLSGSCDDTGRTIHVQMELQPQQGLGPLLAWQPRPSLVTEQLSALVTRRAALGAAVVRWIPGTCTPCHTQPLVTHHEDLMHDPGIFAATASFSVLLQGMERTAEQILEQWTAMLTGSQAELTPSSDQPAFTFQLEAKSGKKHPSHEIEALTRFKIDLARIPQTQIADGVRMDATPVLALLEAAADWALAMSAW